MSFCPTMLILYGPPGTGKTWLAARKAVGTVEPEKYRAWEEGKLKDEDLLARHDQLVLSGRIKWVTFHPSYSYEDFVEGFRPVRSASGETISFNVTKGPFREICDTALGKPGSFGPPVGAVIRAIGGRKTYEVVSSDDLGWFLRVRPERTDSVGEEQEKFVTRKIIERASALGLDPKVFSIPGTGSLLPSDYGLDGADRVVGSELRRQAAELLGISSSDLANSSHFGAVATFIKEQAGEAPAPTPSCLVIDEINRADLSRVFGELITLLEPDKRIGASEERRVHLPYSGEERFGVPSTLSIIGTMNTADRSISAMDFAMRRRFAFMEVLPDPSLCPSNYGDVDIAAALRGINRRIEILRGRDYRLGHASFMERALENTRVRFGWADSKEGRLRALAYVFRRRVVPLLDEYFHEDSRKIEVVLGSRNKRFGKAHNLSMFDSQDLEVAERELVEEVFDTDGVAFGQPAGWWDPEAGEDFDVDGFVEAITAMA